MKDSEVKARVSLVKLSLFIPGASMLENFLA